ncbi:MAG: class I SAM-dependent methyltransferase, partial [Anaerolineales bacterium]|nr:class I SAM-dependent methyltransferase [Anaerolineales bacterium]
LPWPGPFSQACGGAPPARLFPFCLPFDYNFLMHSDTVNQLLELNREFYQTFAPQFSATRQRLQPGVHRIISTLAPHARILDLGCGNGQLARSLQQQGFQGSYTGLDFSPQLLAHTPDETDLPAGFRFGTADLAQTGWENQPLVQALAPYDYIFAFAVLHHLPGSELRRTTLRAARTLVGPDGQFIHSNWQFLNSARLRARILPWAEVGLSDAQLEGGDYLLDWRAGGQGLRYVHHFSSQELHALAAESGFRVCEEFLSDGEGGRLGLYQRLVISDGAGC